MSQVYLEINAQVTPVTPWSDVLIATLGDAGFESFVTTETGFWPTLQLQTTTGIKLKVYCTDIRINVR